MVITKKSLNNLWWNSGKVHPVKGMKFNEEIRAKMRINRAKQKIVHTKETKEKIKLAMQKYRTKYSNMFKAEKSRFWKGGISYEPYGIEFNKSLKIKIRERDNHTCQECGFIEEQLKYKLPIHHIDYNKKNNDTNNLISLCRSCHSQTNYNRDDWIKYYQQKIKELEL